MAAYSAIRKFSSSWYYNIASARLLIQLPKKQHEDSFILLVTQGETDLPPGVDKKTLSWPFQYMMWSTTGLSTVYWNWDAGNN